MKKFAITFSVILLLIICTIAAATIVYAKSEDYQSSTLPDNITINGVDCSDLTYEQASSKLTEEWNKKTLTVEGEMGEKLESFTDFGCTYNINDSLSTIKKEHLIFSALNHYIHTPVTVEIAMKMDEYDEDFKNEVAASSLANDEDATETQDAYVDLTEDDFPIVKEVYGTKVDVDKLFDAFLENIQTGDFTFVFTESDYYSQPSVTSEDEDLLAYQEFCRSYLKQKITYSLGDETFTISVEELSGLLKDDMSGDADEEAVTAYVQELASKFNNIGTTRTITTFSGKTVTLYGGTYGWQIDQEGEAEQLMDDIGSHEDVTREPVYSHQGYGEYTRTVGDTYIDVDVSKQTVKLYIDGELKFTSDCVTGSKANGTTTSIGMYYILNKVTDVVLKSENADGTTYDRPVDYWLGVTWGGQGFHDADWRSSFGGDIWLTNGSHGCINMPVSKMPTLYALAEVGMPVLLHY